MPVQIQHRGDVAAQWTSVNPVLADRELALETDTGKWKIGNGVSTWVSLDYAVNANSVTSLEYLSLVNRVSANSAIGGGGSVTSAEVQTVSAQAASAIASEISNRTSADNALSTAINVVSNAVSAEAVTRAAGDATLSAAITIVSNAVSAEAVTRAANDATLSAAITIVSNAASAAEVHASTASAAATSADGHANTVSARLVSVSAEVVSLIQIASAAAMSADGHAATASLAATSADGHANTASAAATSVNNRVNSVNIFVSGISARSVGNVSTHGFQSVVDALSNRISAVVGGTGSVTSAELAAAVAVETSNRTSAVNQEISDRDAADQALQLSITANSARVVSVSAELASLVQIASAAATSADGHANTVSARLVSVSAELASLINSVSVTMVSVQSTLSHLASIVSLVSAVSAGGTAVGLQSVINALSNRISAIPGGGSTNAVAFVSVANVICAAALTNISGMTVSVSTGVLYELRGMIMYSTSTTTGCAFGLTFPAMTNAAGALQGNKSVNPAGTSTFSLMEFGSFDGTDSGSAVWSAAVTGAGLLFLEIKGTLLPSAGGVVVPQARASVATNAVTIVRGSWMRVFKLS